MPSYQLLQALPPSTSLPSNGPSKAFRQTVPGTFEIHGPMSVLATSAQPPRKQSLVLEFEYFFVSGVPAFAVLPGPPYEARTHRRLPAIGQYDPLSRPFLSLTHHWAEAGPKNWHGSKTMIDLLARFSAAEGDFAWAVAHHPYPQDLRNPRTWEVQQATRDFLTKKSPRATSKCSMLT